MIPNPETDGRLLLALDDCTNPKVGKKVFGTSHVFDHAAKTNQSKYPWAQCFTCIGLLKKVKGRWICLPLIHRFYLPKKALDANRENMNQMEQEHIGYWKGHCTFDTLAICRKIFQCPI